MQDRYLTRRQSAAFLDDQLGLKISFSQLQKLAVVGGGPEYEIFGNKAVYKPTTLIEWAMAKLRAPRRSTSETA